MKGFCDILYEIHRFSLSKTSFFSYSMRDKFIAALHNKLKHIRHEIQIKFESSYIYENSEVR